MSKYVESGLFYVNMPLLEQGGEYLLKHINTRKHRGFFDYVPIRCGGAFMNGCDF